MVVAGGTYGKGGSMNILKPIMSEIAASGPEFPSYSSGGLTPDKLSEIFREADAGDVGRQSELFEEMEEKDAHLGAVLQTRKLAVAGLDWDIHAGGRSPEDAAAASFVREAFFWIENLDDALADMLDAIGKGFSVSELIWEFTEDKYWVREIRWRHPKNFTFLTPPGDKGFALSRSPRLLTEENPVYGEELQANKFIVHLNRSRSGYAFRSGVLRPCAWMYLFKNYTVKDWMVFNERFAMPMRVGKFKPSATAEEKKVLRQAVFNLGADAAAVISDSTVIEILESSGKSPSAELYERLASFCDAAVSKAVLGQTLTTEQKGGAYATAKVHESVREEIRSADAKALEKTVNMQLVRPLAEFNFGPSAEMPRFRFRRRPDEDLRALAETYGALVREVGFKGITDSHIRERFGIPEAHDEKGREV